MKINEKVDNAVKDFTADIIDVAKEYNYNSDIDVITTEITSLDKTQAARQNTVTSELGMIIVFPDFNHNSAQATIVNIGEIKRLETEGFDDEFIEEQGVIYHDLVAYTKDNVRMLAYYLTHRININDKKTFKI